MTKLRYFKGFTLLEVAIVLAVVGLLLAGGVNLLSSSGDTAKYKQTQSDLQEVKEALITYFIQNNGVLPCPDIDNDPNNTSYGDADYNSGSATAGGVCTNYEGWLPHANLGIGGGDAWGERYKYVVSRAFTATAVSPPSVCTGGVSRDAASTAWRISLYDLSNGTSVPPAMPSGALVGDWAAFALISTGKNGRQANANITPSSVGAFQGCSGLNPREQYHCVATTVSATQPFYLRHGTPMSDGATITFDDTVVWVGDMQLISQLRKTGICETSSSGTGGGSGSGGTGGSGGSTPAVCSTSANYIAKCNAGCPGFPPPCH